MSFFTELKRRNVFKVAVAYGIVAWLLIQIIVSIETPLGLPDWTDTLVIVLIAIGFPLAMLLSWAFEVTPEGLKPTTQVASTESISHLTGRKLDFVIIGVLVLAVGYLVLDRGGEDEAASPAVSEASAPASETAVPDPSAVEPVAPVRDRLENSVAVLPFDNMSDDPEDAYFASGIHEETLNRLAKLSKLSVISRTSMLQYADTALSIPEIAEDLNVETVLEGSVRYAGDRVRVTAQLIDALTDEHLWSEVYERDLEDIFFIQSDIAMNIANAMEAEFSLEEQASIEEIPTDSLEAYALILRLTGLLDGGARRTAERLRAQIDLAERAIELDPDYVDAHGHRGMGYTDLIAMGEEGDGSEYVQRATESGQRTLELDPSSHLGHRTLGRIAQANGNWEEAAQHYAESVESGAARALTNYVYLSLLMGNIEEAVTTGLRNVSLNPNIQNAHTSYMRALFQAESYEEVAAHLRTRLQADPSNAGYHGSLFIAESFLGNTEEALREARLMEELRGNPVWAAYEYYLTGFTEDAHRLLAQRRERGSPELGVGQNALRQFELFVALIEQDEEEIKRLLPILIRPETSTFWLSAWKMYHAWDEGLQIPEFDAAYAAIGL